MFGRSIPILMYHHVSPVGGDVNVLPEIFEDQLNALTKEGWKTLSGDEFLYHIQSKDIPRKAVLITFDDGFVDNYIYAYPILKKNNMKAMLFVAAGFIEEKDMQRNSFNPIPHKEAWKLAFTERRSEVICTWKELIEMEENGVFDIQSHGYYHKTATFMKDGNYAELKEDLFIGKTILEERLSKKIFHFAWPHGYYDQSGIQIATELGYKALYTTERGSNTIENLTMLRRLPVKNKKRGWLIGKLSIYSSVFFSKLYLTLRKGK